MLYSEKKWHVVTDNFKIKFDIFDLKWEKENLLLVDLGSKFNQNNLYNKGLKQLYLVNYDEHYNIKETLLILSVSNLAQITKLIEINPSTSTFKIGKNSSSYRPNKDSLYGPNLIAFYFIKAISFKNKVVLVPIVVYQSEINSENNKSYKKKYQLFANPLDKERLFCDPIGKKGVTLQFEKINTFLTWVYSNLQPLRNKGYKLDISSIFHLNTLGGGGIDFDILIQIFTDDQGNDLFEYKKDNEIKLCFGSNPEKESIMKNNFTFYAQKDWAISKTAKDKNADDPVQFSLTGILKNDFHVLISRPPPKIYSILKITRSTFKATYKFRALKDLNFALENTEALIQALDSDILIFEKTRLKCDSFLIDSFSFQQNEKKMILGKLFSIETSIKSLGSLKNVLNYLAKHKFKFLQSDLINLLGCEVIVFTTEEDFIIIKKIIEYMQNSPEFKEIKIGSQKILKLKKKIIQKNKLDTNLIEKVIFF